MGHFATEEYRNNMACDFYCDLFQHPYIQDNLTAMAFT